jgi:hypothetical protein
MSALCQKRTSVRVISFPATTVFSSLFCLLIVQPHQVLPLRGLDPSPGF